VFAALDHAVIAVRELDAAADAYASLLGRRPSWRGEHAGLGTANALFRLANGYLELLAPRSDERFGAELRARIERDGEGLFALALATDDAAACAGALRARGIAAVGPIEGEGEDAASGAKRRWLHALMPEADLRGLFVFAIEHLSPADALRPAQAVGEEAACVSAFDHVVVRTSDPEASIALWRDRLGVRLALDRTFEERGVRLIFFRLGGVTIEFAARLGEGEPGGQEHDRLWGLAWQAPDVDGARARLARAGFDVSEVRPGNKPGTRVCTVRAGTCGVPTLIIGPD
jgi:catechol 2,3-dioxygenase-like lactoylglutathione lyase family enzyme